MAEIVNLRAARKRKARADKEKTSAENRARHGATKAERQARLAREERDKAAHDGHRLGPPEDKPHGNRRP